MTPPFLETEIAISFWSRHPDDDVIDQMELQDSAAFENSPGEAHIRIRSGRVARWVVVHQDKGVRGVNDNRLKYFPWMRETHSHCLG